MPHIDDFWDDIVDDGLVDPDQGGRARARFIQIGGGLDTAVLENAALDAEARQTLLETAARALGRKLAAPTALADPDAEAVRHIPRPIIDRYGVMPARDQKGRLILITPPLAPHVFNELKSRLGRSFDVRLALEIDIRLALARHFDVPLPSRFEVLRAGKLPGRSALSGVTARRPMPKPRAAAALMPVPAAPETPAPPAPSGNPNRSWLSEASGKLRHARDREGLFRLLASAGEAVLDGRFYLLRLGVDRLQCVAGAGLGEGGGPILELHRDSRLDHALRIGSSRLEDWSHDPDLTALYTVLGRARPARVMIEPIRDGLEVVGVFVGDHGRAGIDRGVVGDLRRWLSRISTRLADLRESQAPAAQPPPMIEPPPPPPRVAPPPPAGRAPMPPADPFAPPGRRRRPRKPLDLQDLAEAARTAQATADDLPSAESQEFMVRGLASAAPPPEPAAPPALESAPIKVEPPTTEFAPAPPPDEARLPAPFSDPSDGGLPFDVDDDPLAGFLSDPEIEAVADALVADEPTGEADSPPPAMPGAATGPLGMPAEGADEMGAPPNTMPSRPQAMPRAPTPPSVFEAVLPRVDAADADVDLHGTPPPTRPARPSAGRSADPRASEPPSPAIGEQRPGPTVNLRGPEAEVERRKRPTADLGPRPADISVDELVEEARALGLQHSAPPAEPAPPRPAKLRARSTVDLKGDAEDDPLDDPPPLDDADEPHLHARKTINLRRAEPSPPPPDAVLELDDADVLEVSDEPDEPDEPAAVDVQDGDVVEVVEPAPVMPLGPEAEALRARRELEEADTGVFTVVGDPVESRPLDPPATDGVDLAEAETAELRELPTGDSDPPPSVGELADEVFAGTSADDEPAAEASAGASAAEEPAAEVSAGTSAAEEPAAEVSAGTSAAEEPAAEVSAGAAADEELADEASVGTSANDEPADEVSAGAAADDEPADEVSAGAAADDEPADEVSAGISVVEEPADEASAGTAADDEPADEVSAGAAADDEPADEVSAGTSADDEPADEVSAGAAADDEPADEVSAGAAADDEPAAEAPAEEDLDAEEEAPIRTPRHSVEPSGPPIALDDLLDAQDDELSDLDLVLSPPPAPQPSPTFEAIESLDLDGNVDGGADFDLDLGLGAPDPAADADPAPAGADAGGDPPLPTAPGPDAEKMAEALTALLGDDPEIARTAEEVLVAGGATALEPLFEIFPGPLVVDRYAIGETAPVARHGPVLRTICRIGAAAGPHLAARCDHLAPDVRYYAVYAFSAVRDPASVAAIAPTLTDKDATVRAIACRVADSYRGDEIFGVLVAHLVNIVEKGRLADRRLAAEALGNLHAVDGVAPLIAMLGAPQPPLRDAAHKALVEIARQDFGQEVWRWRAFFERSADRPRIEWLLDGLLSDRRAIRVGAFRELKRVTHQNYGYTPDAPPATRRASAERWVRWWHQTGRAKFGHYR